MKKLHFLVLALLCIAFFCSCGVKKVDSLQREKKDFPKKEVSERETKINDDRIKIGIDESEFSEEFAKAFSKENGIDAEIVRYSSLAKAKEGIKNGEIKIYLGNFPKEAEDTIDFCVSAPYFRGESCIVALSEAYTYDKENDIAGYIKGTAQEMLVGNYFSQARGYEDFSRLTDALGRGEVSCVFLDSEKYKHSGTEIYNGYFLFDTYSYSRVAVLNQKDAELTKEIDVFLAKFKASGEADDISEKYFGESFVLK